MPDIADQLDAAIGTAPPPAPPLDRTLAEGRRALARRRTAYVVGAVATAVVIGGTAWVAAPGDGGPLRSDPGFSGPGTVASASASTPATVDAPPEKIDWLGPDAAMVDGDGHLLVKTGWTVVHRIDKVNGPGTLGVEIRKGDRRQWFLFGEAMTISSLHAPSEGHSTFQEWIDVNGPLIEGTPPRNSGKGDADGWPGEPREDLVAFGDGEVLVPLAGVTILEQRPSPQVGSSFAKPSDTSAVALVASDGKQYYVLAREVDGPAQYIAVPKAEGGADIDAFLAFARERYAEGGGGLL
jgi:hypothetical protein